MKSPTHCPSCRQTMVRKTFERQTHGSVELDLCFNCQGIWLSMPMTRSFARAAIKTRRGDLAFRRFEFDMTSVDYTENEFCLMSIPDSAKPFMQHGLAPRQHLTVWQQVLDQ